MQLKLDTEVRITTSIGKRTEESVMTLKRLGFTQDDLFTLAADEIEQKIQDKFVGYAVEYVEYE